MTKAKTVAKTAGAKVAKKAFYYNGKVIKPVRYISLERNFMSAQDEGGNLIMDVHGQPAAWAKIRKEVK